MRDKIIILYSMVAMTLMGCSATSNVEYIVPLKSGEKTPKIERSIGLVSSLAPSKYFEDIGVKNKERSFHSEIEYLEVLLSYGINEDARPMLLLLNYYVASNQQPKGIDFFQRYLKRYENNMDKITKSNILSAYAVLRATYANDVALIKRIPWVLDTFDLLDEAKELSKDNNPIVHWSSGLIYAQMPFFFNKHEDALRELEWLASKPETEPMPGFYREVYHYLAKLYEKDGEHEKAQKYLAKIGYDKYEPKSLFMDWLTSTNKDGLTFAPTPWMEDVIENKIYSMHGFGFSDIHFIVSEDKEELIAVDAGTQPFSAKAAYEFLKKKHPDIPKLTTLLVTHAHWDHVGGYKGLVEINPQLKIIGNKNFRNVLKRATREPKYIQFRSETYENSWLNEFKHTKEINTTEEIIIGGTTIELTPVIGNETEDALFINLPKESVLFVGDVMMPYLGDPWIEEGFIQEPIATMKTITKYNAKHILHGHYGLTFMYKTNQQINAFTESYTWFINSVEKYIENGYSRHDIMRLNLIPPMLKEHYEIYIGFLAQRNNIISRMVDQMTGYWHEDKTKLEPQGFYSLTSVEYGRMLSLYLNLSEREISNGLQMMIKNGDLELALKLSIAALNRYPNSLDIKRQKEESADRLRSMSQFFDPMKFSVYTEMIEKEHRPITK